MLSQLRSLLQVRLRFASWSWYIPVLVYRTHTILLLPPHIRIECMPALPASLHLLPRIVYIPALAATPIFTCSCGGAFGMKVLGEGDVWGELVSAGSSLRRSYIDILLQILGVV